MRNPIWLVLPLLVPALAPSQSLADYLRLRDRFHITQPTAGPAIDRLVGDRTVEVRGIVRGSFRSEKSVSLMLDRVGSDTMVVESANPPEWLIGNEAPVRMLVRIGRTSPSAPATAKLIAVASERDVAPVEDAYWKREAQKRNAVTRRNQPASASRGLELKGPIGRSDRRREWVLPPSEVAPIYASFIKGRNPRLSNAKAMEIARAILGFSMHYGVDARLVIAMVMVESDFDPNSTSHSGAMGLGQLMPGTARWMGVQNAYDTTDNLYGTVKLLRTHMSQYTAQTGQPFQGMVLALAAYNAGEGAVRRHGGVPPYRETQAYVARVIRIYGQLCGV